MSILSKFGIEDRTEEDKLREENKRLRIVANMAAQSMIDLDYFLRDQNSSCQAGVITRKDFDQIERRNKNLNLALKFAGYSDIHPTEGYPVRVEGKEIKLKLNKAQSA